jgi:hypothetical protein
VVKKGKCRTGKRKSKWCTVSRPIPTLVYTNLSHFCPKRAPPLSPDPGFKSLLLAIFSSLECLLSWPERTYLPYGLRAAMFSLFGRPAFTGMSALLAWLCWPGPVGLLDCIFPAGKVPLCTTTI